MNAARALRWARLTAGLTQRELAEKAGIPQSTIGRIEAGRIDPRSRTLSRLLRACGYDLEVEPILGLGVDRSLIRAMLALRPEQRVADLAQEVRFLKMIDEAREKHRREGDLTRGDQEVSMARARKGHEGEGGPEQPPPGGEAGDEEFDLPGILRVLNRHRVSFVVIGGVAARFHGSASMTLDLDICYERTRPNMNALAAALRELHATLRGADPNLPFLLDARTLEFGDSFTFSTDAGSLDCLGTPAGTGGYADLVRKAADFHVAGVTIKVASLDDLIRMKKASGRPKDRIELEILGALRAEIDGEEP